MSGNGLVASHVPVGVEVLYGCVFCQDVVVGFQLQLYPLVRVMNIEGDVKVVKVIDPLRGRLDGGLVKRRDMTNGTWSL